MPDQKTILMQQLITLLTQLLALNEAEETAPAAQSDAVEMLTIKECAALVPGLSEHTIRKLALKGAVTCVRTGEGKNGKILINKESLLNYLNGVA
ncbi:hypothetical protein SAMN02910317_01972 [Ruminococcaceae bacterium FB2012]|nr:hypothetical protein SAMN02910317_01972 [Ruminococcaceae bacterium FB2012]